jgi:hypothetical protein
LSKDLIPNGSASRAGRKNEVVARLVAPSEISTRSSGQIEYIPSELVGFEYVPEQVARQLRGDNVIAAAEIAAWAEPPVAKRRKDGSVYQVVANAWWADNTRLVVFEVVRDLEDLCGTNFRPTGAWVPRGTAYQLPAGISAITYSCTPESGGSQKDGAGAATAAEHPLDVLPQYLQPPLRGGMAGARIEWGRKWARETVVAQRVDAGRVRVLRAEREGKSQQSLLRSTWTITSLEAAVAGSWRIGPAPRSTSSVPATL